MLQSIQAYFYIPFTSIFFTISLPYIVVLIGNIFSFVLLLFSLYKVFRCLWNFYNSRLDALGSDSPAPVFPKSTLKLFVFFIIFSIILLWFFGRFYVPYSNFYYHQRR